MEHYKTRPCKLCRQSVCRELDCEKWQEWFLEGWQQLQAYAWEQMDRQGRQQADTFCYELPHLVKSPCEGCACSPWCNTPCSQRLRWWDQRIGRLYGAR